MHIFLLNHILIEDLVGRLESRVEPDIINPGNKIPR